MALRERSLPDSEGGGSTRLRIDNPDVKRNPQKTLGIWILFVSAETRDKVIQGLRRGVENGLFTSVWLDEAPADSGGPKSSVWAMEEGYVTRRMLKARLEAFERMGFDGGWIYCDAGAERHKSARRALCGKSPRPPVTEFDYRAGGDEHVRRRCSFHKKQPTTIV